MARNYRANSLEFFIVPGDTFLFSMQDQSVPREGELVAYLDAETQLITRYRVQDVIYEIEEFPTIPPAPPGPGFPLNHGITKHRIEIQVVP